MSALVVTCYWDLSFPFTCYIPRNDRSQTLTVFVKSTVCQSTRHWGTFMGLNMALWYLREYFYFFFFFLSLLSMVFDVVCTNYTPIYHWLGNSDSSRKTISRSTRTTIINVPGTCVPQYHSTWHDEFRIVADRLTALLLPTAWFRTNAAFTIEKSLFDVARGYRATTDDTWDFNDSITRYLLHTTVAAAAVI